MDCSMPGFLVLYYLLEVDQVCVHCVGGSCLYHLLSSRLPLVLSLSQHQDLFQRVGASGGQNIEASVSVLSVNIQG